MTVYWLDGPGIKSRWGGEIFLTRPDLPVAHPVYCTMGTGSLPGIMRPGRCVDHPPHLVPRLRKLSGVINLLPFWAFVTSYRVKFTFNL